MVVRKCIVYDFHADGWSVFAKPYKIQVLVVHIRRQTCQLQDTCQYIMAMVTALLGIDIKYAPFAFGQTGPIVQYGTIGKGSCHQG